MSDKLKTIVIDDEQPARDLMRFYLDNHPQIELVGEYQNGFDGVKAIMKEKIDLVFLDIQMPKLNGFEMLELIDQKPAIVFTTAHDEFALKAFEQNAVDYLLKPFAKERLLESIARVIASQGAQTNSIKKLQTHIQNNEEQIDRIIVKSGVDIDIISLDAILYLEAEDDYVSIHTSKKRYLKKNTLSFYETKLDPMLFVRIHRSFVVNIREIKKVEKYSKDGYICILKQGQTLHISRSGYKKLRETLRF